MSEIDEVLQLFGFFTLDEVTPEGLKRAFKTNIIRAHPDKGGSPELFDKMLQSYVYLTETVQRVYGGRATLQNIVSPEELKGMRPDEIVNRFFEEFDREQFNKLFEEKNEVSIKLDNGYQNWLKNKEGEVNLIDGEYGDATQKPPTFIFKEMENFNNVFEETVKKDKPEPSAIILHPEAMAYISGQTIGTEIIDAPNGDYTSAPFLRPEYTDVFAAFNTANTITDKVATFQNTNKSLDTLIAERNQAITPLNCTELKAIQEYEKKKLDNNISNLSNIKQFYEHDTNVKTSILNWPVEAHRGPQAFKGFVINL
jgi:hypothetical protein